MDHLSIPSVTSMPALSRGTTTDGISIGSSAISSGLTTPDDNCPESATSMDFFAQKSIQKKEVAFIIPHTDYDGADSLVSKTRSWSRAVAKTKKFVEKTLNVRKTLRKGREGTRTSLTSSQSLNEGDLMMPRSRMSINVKQDMVSDVGAEGVVNPSISVHAEPSEDISSSLDVSQISSQAEIEVSSEYLLGTFSSLSSEESLEEAWGPWTAHKIAVSVVRMLFFLPWCIAVGGSILLSPRHLELITFSPGYMASAEGPRRFAYWADCAVPHIVIFLAAGAALLWWDMSRGVVLVAALLARFLYVWQDFRVDLSVSLGEDDQQSLYLAVTKVYLKDGFVMSVPMREPRAEEQSGEEIRAAS